MIIQWLHRAPVAQLDRASAFEAEGREFESPRARHNHFTCDSSFQSLRPRWFAKMISDAKSLKISDIHIDVRAWEDKTCNIHTVLFAGQRRFSVGTIDCAGWQQDNPVVPARVIPLVFWGRLMWYPGLRPAV